MTLSIAAIPQSHWRNLMPLLEALGWQKDQKAPESWYLGANAQPKSSIPPDHYVLLHERPEFAVANAIDAGQSPDEALQQWSASVDALFSLYRSAAQNAIMLDIHSVPGNEQSLLAWLAEHRSEWQPIAGPGDTEISLPRAPQPTALPLLLAREIVSNDDKVAPRLRRLEAMSIPLIEAGYNAPRADATALFNEYRNQTKEVADSRDATNGELSLLELQLTQVQEELEQSERHKAQLEQQLQDASTAKEATNQKKQDHLNEEIQRLQEKLAVVEKTLGGELKDAKAENELLILQLHQVQEELESIALREQNQQIDLKEAQHKIQVLTERTEAAARETSQLKSSEVQLRSDLERTRNELDVASRELRECAAELESSGAELSLVKDHLANTQEDLKVQYHRNEQLDYQLQQKQIEISDLNSCIAEKNRKLQKLSQGKKQAVAERDEQKKLKQAAEHRNNLLETELDKLHRSFTWRLASPVRMIGGVAGAVHKPSRQQKTIKQQAALIEESGLFDEAWYLDRYPDVLNTDMKPAEHYLKHGAAEGRDPSEHFSTRWYLEKYSDVADSGINPVLHYILYGKEEMRKPLPTKKK